VNVLVDILHPAHVHFFKHAIPEWQARGHRVHVTVRDKDITRLLLDRLGIPYENLGAPRTGRLGLLAELVGRDLRLLRVVRRVRPDVLVAIGGVTTPQVGWLRRIPSVVFTDTENATLSNRLTFPFATVVCTPACFEAPVRARRHFSYAGYHELAYLHPARFTSDPEALRPFSVTADEPFIVVRLVAWGALHDVGDRGFTDVVAAVRRLERHGRVLVTAEGDLPADIASRRITATPEQIHHLLAFARLFIGESATMASESAILGTPAIFVSTSVRGYTNEQERRYDLTYTFSDASRQERALAKAESILSDPHARERWGQKRERMLADTIDVTAFVVETVEAVGREGAAATIPAVPSSPVRAAG
jgi:predicted glycosyltransferase